MPSVWSEEAFNFCENHHPRLSVGRVSTDVLRVCSERVCVFGAVAVFAAAASPRRVERGLLCQPASSSAPREAVQEEENVISFEARALFFRLRRQDIFLFISKLFGWISVIFARVVLYSQSQVV